MEKFHNLGNVEQLLSERILLFDYQLVSCGNGNCLNVIFEKK